MRISWMIGGAQGTGVDTSANIFGAAVAKAGYYLYGSREYYSNIKGRHSYFNVTISDKPQSSVSEKVNILVTFDSETVFQHFREVTEFVIYDKNMEAIKAETVRSIEPELLSEIVAELEKKGLGTTVADAVKYMESNGVKAIPIQYGEITARIMNELKLNPVIVDRSRNIIGAATSLALLGIKKDYLIDQLKAAFKNETFVKLNTMAVEAGYALAQNHYSLPELKVSGNRVQVDGTNTSAMGKLAAGLRFQSYYPITPASDESVYIEANQMLDAPLATSEEAKKVGVAVVQTEDELAAINSAIGAALTGARAATATSGPGFSLMSEGISWAGMDEAPVTISYYMRGAPATGLPTRSGQADLKFAINVGHGEFPKIVIASGDHLEVFQDAFNALNWAEAYQCPVIHIIEKTLANSYSIIDEDKFDLSKMAISRGLRATKLDGYKRFEITENGISPRAFLDEALMLYTGDEHNEYGHISEASQNRLKMYEKRLKKLQQAADDIPDELKANVIGNSDIVLLTWGSPKGAILDSMEELGKAGINVEMVQVRLFSPYPTELMKKLLSGKKTIIALENNYYAQAAEVLAEKTGINPTNYILKWTGRPVYKEELIDAVTRIIKNNEKKVVLDGGS
ncbi:MAG: 2-oxoacid:acceptor oxidoreductase subunit alpha [Candidatus Micrarchaeales archaeon]|jgi:Pyruvate:ferredoxin oxidoreductase and related 2-oxoacid:ferredoxin oxidoreductases, alpha subunit|uniref:2-oxoacid oxidoreductase (ferredoxin) n=1 Tax=Candidatus Micrarchaeum acidiphilum ARMAN-2 TaxID=425595 RepID=C7DI77_MICA2|nr:MAG: pyruvate flavodoxin/ferredoxin oxidoreductase domain protein [Candidatus Micrarchaeum acidiphilum ARMAN-2]MCW6160901.1 2-oxoacid:acceptor oxidoreductase subunit alpha [Candidatus Micrarchaeales archaeon]